MSSPSSGSRLGGAPPGLGLGGLGGPGGPGGPGGGLGGPFPAEDLPGAGPVEVVVVCQAVAIGNSRSPARQEFSVQANDMVEYKREFEYTVTN